MDCDAQLAATCLFMPTFWPVIITHTVGHTDLVLVCDQASLVGICTQHNKSLSAVVTNCATLVNIQTHTETSTHRQHFDQLIQKAQPAELKKTCPSFSVSCF